MHIVLASGGIAHLYFTTATLLPTTVTLLRTRKQFTMYIQCFFLFCSVSTNLLMLLI